MFCTRAPVSGSWVVGPRGRGFFHGSVYRRRKRRRWPWGLPEDWNGEQRICLRVTAMCLLSTQENLGSGGSEQSSALTGCWGPDRWPGTVIHPRRTGGCSLSAICACQAPAKTALHRNPQRCLLSVWQARRGRQERSGTKLCLKKNYKCQWISVFLQELWLIAPNSSCRQNLKSTI